MKKHKITRAELNEKSWERKKLKKKKGLARRGNRANPHLLESQAPSSQQNTTESKKENKAIPLFIKSRKEPLVAKDLPTIQSATAEQASEPKEQATSGQAVDLVVTNGKVVSTKELEQAHKKAKQKSRAQQAKSAPTTIEGNKKLGRAALRRLEKENRIIEDDFATAKEQDDKAESNSTIVNQEDRRIKSRDYKAGRNTNYVATQAAAEKAIKPKVKKRKLSGEELLDAWENIKW